MPVFVPNLYLSRACFCATINDDNEIKGTKMDKKDIFRNAMDNLSNAIGARADGWDKVPISNIDSVIIKPFTNDFELKAVELLVREFAADRLAVLPSVTMGNTRYMVMAYAGEADRVRKSLADRVAKYNRGESRSIFGVDGGAVYYSDERLKDYYDGR